MIFPVGDGNGARLGYDESQGVSHHSSYEDPTVEGHDSKHHQVSEADAKEVDTSLNQRSHDGASPALDEWLVGQNLNSHG